MSLALLAAAGPGDRLVATPGEGEQPVVRLGLVGCRLVGQRRDLALAEALAPLRGPA